MGRMRRTQIKMERRWKKSNRKRKPRKRSLALKLRDPKIHPWTRIEKKISIAYERRL
jgi:hypothetical protein